MNGLKSAAEGMGQVVAKLSKIHKLIESEARLPAFALGAVGELVGARGRYETSRLTWERDARGTTKDVEADVVSVLERNAKEYLTAAKRAEDAVQAAGTPPDTKVSVSESGERAVAPLTGLTTIATTAATLAVISHGSMERHKEDYRRAYSSSLGAPEREKSRLQVTKSNAEKYSKRALKLLNGSARISVAATVGAVIYATTVISSDQTNDDAVSAWLTVEDLMRSISAEDVPAVARYLELIWNGEAKRAAETRLDDLQSLVSSGADNAAEVARLLTEMIETLNLLHFSALICAHGGLIFIALYSLIPTPVAVFQKEKLGARLSMAVSKIYRMIAAIITVAAPLGFAIAMRTTANVLPGPRTRQANSR
ncbi:hypothetical protein [Nonomuraea sp. B19D2]|uniref:hypothetical protein n=1 Tax=Nonomuraea sp. B19D2 TaxID=3159561 RepID=UPI0032DBEB22